MGAKEIIIWLVVFVVGSLIVTFLVSPNSFNNFKSNVKSIIPPSSSPELVSNSQVQEDALISKCKSSFNECKSITESKYDGGYINIIKIEKFSEKESALDFYDTWRNIFVQPSSKALGKDETINSLLGLPSAYIINSNSQPNNMFENKIPFVLIAIKMGNTNAGMSNSYVAVCSKEGELSDSSKRGLLCG